MTWGSHCSMCGSTECSWVDGDMCEGRMYRQILRDTNWPRTPWWRRLFKRKRAP